MSSYYTLSVTNNGSNTASLGSSHGTFYVLVPAGETVSKEIPLAQLKNMHEVITSFESRELEQGGAEFTITIKDPEDNPIDFKDLPFTEAGPGIFIPLDQGGH